MRKMPLNLCQESSEIFLMFILKEFPEEISEALRLAPKSNPTFKHVICRLFCGKKSNFPLEVLK